METQSKVNKLKHTFISYLADHKLIASIAVYFIVSIILKMVLSIDILIPCIWKLLFHVDCLGCGLTTAIIKLLQFDFYGAFQANFMVFLILPFGLFYLFNDFSKYRKRL